MKAPKPRELHRSACHEVLSIRTDVIEKGGHSSSLTSLLGAILTFHKIPAMETACHPQIVWPYGTVLRIWSVCSGAGPPGSGQISGTSRNRTPAIIEGPACAAHDHEWIWCDALQNEEGSFQVISQDVRKGHPFCLISAIHKDWDSVYLQGYCKSDV
jgi:hypothetical protein